MKKFFVLLLLLCFVFALSLTGCKGETGAPGANGINGKDGVDGIDGKDGINGIDGVDGKNGVDGKDGKDGKNGTVITIGENGNWFLDGVDSGISATAATNPFGFDFYLQPDNTYAIGVGKARYMEEITIPSAYNGKQVTAIAEEGFYKCPNLKTVFIASSIVKIYESAFSNCSNLINVCFETDGQLTFIDSCAFAACEKIEILEIPANVSSINTLAFQNCSALAELSVASNNNTYHSNGECIIETQTSTLILGCQNSVIPADGSVTKIGKYAFAGNKGLISIDLPSSISYIGEYAFSGCENLKQVKSTKREWRVFSISNPLSSAAVYIPSSSDFAQKLIGSYCDHYWTKN